MTIDAPATIESQVHKSVLAWKNGLYGKIAVLVSVVSLIFYVLHDPNGVPNGGSTLGYTYGTIGVLLIMWLGWFGIRKKQYKPNGLLLEEWLSAHIYLGLSLIFIATFHTGFSFHWNVHTLGYVLMCLVIVSGIFGLVAYRRYPSLLTRNRAGVTLRAITTEIAAQDVQCRYLSLAFDDVIVDRVAKATGEVIPRISWNELIFGRSHDKVLSGPTKDAIDALRALIVNDIAAPREVLPLVQALTQRATLVERARRDYRYRVMMKVWRAFHVPLTIGLLMTLAIHVFSVFYYW